MATLEPPRDDDEARRIEIAKRFAAVTSTLTTKALAEIEQRHPWFIELDAEHRSWITLVARAGIDGFTDWFVTNEQVTPSSIFSVAPRSILRQVSLEHTVELVRTTIDVVEHSVQEMLPEQDQAILSVAIITYSREVAFAAAHVYARAAETRGAWDARLEALLVDAIMRNEGDDIVSSRASSLGIPAQKPTCVVIGATPHSSEVELDRARHHAAELGFDVLAAIQGERLIVILTGDALDAPNAATAAVTALLDHFADGPVVVGPTTAGLATASSSARDALAGFHAAAAWPEAPRPVNSTELLPERSLSGDGRARRRLVDSLYIPLVEAGGDLLETAVAFFENSGSVEGTGRALYVHPNTVRYRLKRIREVTGYSISDSRDSYALRIAISLGRLFDPTTRPSA